MNGGLYDNHRLAPERCSFGGRLLLIAAMAAALSACASYEPMPANPAALADATKTSSGADLVLAAASLKHPLLPPVTITEDGSLSAQGAAVVAVIQSPALRAVRSRRGVAEAQLIQAGLLPNPQLSANIDFPVAGATDGAINAFGIGASWDITSLITKEQERLAASRGADAVSLDIAWQEWQVAMSAKLHATRVLWLSVQREELRRQAQQSESVAEAAEANRKSGLVTMIESEASSALYQKRRMALLAVESSLVSESGLLRQALGLPSDTRIRIVEDAEETAASLPSEQDVNDAITHTRLDLAALHAGYASQESKLHAAVLSQFPKIGLGITRARDTSDVGTLGFGITLDLPIFDRGQGRIAIERATRQQLFDELAARTFEARSDAERSLAELRAIKPQVEESRRTADRLTSLATALAEAQATGDADIVQLTQAQNDASDAVIESLRMRQQEAELRIALEVATGQLIGGVKP